MFVKLADGADTGRALFECEVQVEGMVVVVGLSFSLEREGTF